MAQVITTIASDVTAPVNFVLQRGMLTQARKVMPYHNGTLPGTLMRNGGSMSVRYERWNDLAIATTALGEAASPAVFGLGRDSVAMSITRVDAAVAKYGQAVLYNEEIDLFQVNATSARYVGNLGRNAGESLNALMRDVMTGADVTNIEYANGTATNQVNTVIALNDIKRAVNGLQNNSAMKFLPMTDGSPNTNTTPQRAAFYGICHVDVEEDIRLLSGFVPVEQYASQTQVKVGEFGSINGVRWCATETAPIASGGGATGGTGVRETTNVADVYSSTIYGQEAVGSVGLGETLPDEILMQGDNIAVVEIINKPPGSSGVADMFNEVGTLAWKAWWAGVILNAAWIWEIQSASSDLA